MKKKQEFEIGKLAVFNCSNCADRETDKSTVFLQLLKIMAKKD